MRSRLATLFLLFALPAGLVGYTAGVWLVRAMFGASVDGIILLFVPLFLGGLAMVPFALPFIDRRAKADLAAIRARQTAEGAPDGAPRPPGTGTGAEPRDQS